MELNLRIKKTIALLLLVASFTFSAYSIDLSAVTVDVSGGIISSTSAEMQYSLNSTDGTNGTWADCSNTTTSVNYSAGGFAVYVREKLNTTNFRLVATIPAQAAKPTFTINYITETTNETATQAVEYSLNSNMSNSSELLDAKIPLSPATTLYIRIKATRTQVASQIQTLVIGIRRVAPSFSINYYNEETIESVTSDIVYSERSDLSNSTQATGSKLAITAGVDLYFAYKATANQFRSDIFFLDVPHRPVLQDFTIDFVNERTVENVSSAIEISSSSSMSPSTTGSGDPLSLSPNTTLYLRSAANNGSKLFKSAVKTFVVPARPAAPVFAIDFVNETTTEAIPTTVQYSTNSNMLAASTGNASKASLVPNTDLYFRTLANATQFASAIFALYVPARPVKPSISINYESETTVQFINSTLLYSANANMSEAQAGTGSVLTLIPGKDMYFRNKSTATNFASEILHLIVPQRIVIAAGTFQVDFFSQKTKTAITNSYEYSTNSDMSSAINGTGSKVDLTPSINLYIRQKALSASFRSEIFTLTVPAKPAAPSFSINYQNETTVENVSTNVTYATDANFQNSSGGAGVPLSISPAKTYYFYIIATSTNFASAVSHLIVPARPSAPVYHIDYENEITLETVDTKTNFSSQSKMENAQSGTNQKIALTPSLMMYFQTQATASTFKSDIYTLTVPIRPEAPVYSIDYLTETTVEKIFSMIWVADNPLFTNKLAGQNEKYELTVGKNYYFRKKATAVAFASEAFELIVPQRLEAPKVALNDVTSTAAHFVFYAESNRRATVADNLEYSINEGLTWDNVGNETTVNSFGANHIIVRKKATSTAFYSLATENVDTSTSEIVILLADYQIDENNAEHTSVGTFEVKTLNGVNFSLSVDAVSNGSTDLFYIENNVLKVSKILNYETANIYTVDIRVNYNNKAETHRFSIEVNNTNDAPSAISLSPQTIDENLPTGAAIGSLSATDEDANDSHTFQLTDENGTLTTDNQYFEIVGNTLKTKSMFDFETKSQYSIYVKATDSKGASTAKWLTVNVNNLIETFVNQATLPVFKIYPNPASQWVMVEIDNSLIVNSIELIDICGRVIHSQNMVNGFSRIPLQKCISGLYFIRIIQGENVFTQKLIVKP